MPSAPIPLCRGRHRPRPMPGRPHSAPVSTANADLNRVSERGMIPVLPDHRRRILAASAAYATAQVGNLP